jgi:hypothetical protein
VAPENGLKDLVHTAKHETATMLVVGKGADPALASP